jgi:hypothetical protein
VFGIFIILTLLEEFSNFSKNFENNAPKNKQDLNEFLSIFE